MNLDPWPGYCGAAILSETYKKNSNNDYTYSLDDRLSFRTDEYKKEFKESQRKALISLCLKFEHPNYGHPLRRLVIYFQESNGQFVRHKSFYDELFRDFEVTKIEEHLNPNTQRKITLLKLGITRKSLEEVAKKEGIV